MRSLLLFIILSVFSGFTASSQTVKPVIVIVHGAWGGGWAFKKTDSLLREKGLNVYRPTLTGQGERVHLANADVGLSTHINDVVNTILFEDLRDVVLVGHSYGGMVVTGVADRIPERIKKLVYLDAFVPEDGESVSIIRGNKPEQLRESNPGGFLIPAWVKEGQKPPMDVPHSVKTFTEPIVLKNQNLKNVKAAYILTVDPGKKAEDDGFAKDAARAKQRNWPVLILEADHNPQWSKPAALVDILIQAIQG